MYTIKLTCGTETIVDSDISDAIRNAKWRLHTNGYVMTRWNGKTGLLHRLLLGLEPGKASSRVCVDHINGNRLDNRRSNLRLCDHSQNVSNTPKRIDNTSGVKGVCWYAKRNKWTTYVTFRGKQYYLGYYENFDEAVAVVAAARLRLHGEFANHG